MNLQNLKGETYYGFAYFGRRKEGVLGFFVLVIFRPVFRFLCLLRFRFFSVFSIWFQFSVFSQTDTSGFSDLVSNTIFGLT